MAQQNDPSNALLLRARQGDRVAFDQLVEPRLRRLRSLASRVLGNWPLSGSDVVQETLLEAWKCLPQFRENTLEQFCAWVDRICVSKASHLLRDSLAQIRDLRRTRPLTDGHSSSGGLHEPVAEQPSPSQNAIHNEDNERLARGLTTLRDEEQLVILLKYKHGWTFSAIARFLNRDTSAVAGLFYRALQKLRNVLTDDT